MAPKKANKKGGKGKKAASSSTATTTTTATTTMIQQGDVSVGANQARATSGGDTRSGGDARRAALLRVSLKIIQLSPTRTLGLAMFQHFTKMVSS